MTAQAAAFQAVLDFWFFPEDDARHLQVRDAWFTKDPAFDDTIRTRFGALIAAARAGGLTDWMASGTGCLAYILLLDQFTRNVFRNSGEAFAGDGLALAAAREALARGNDHGLPPVQRWFLYLPFEHSESLADQDRSVALFEAMATASPGWAGALDYARRHQAVIRQFGRFPHRNALLGRPSTADELDYLSQPGAGF